MTDSASLLPIETLCEQARQSDRAGRSQEAESLCLQVLEQRPGHPAAAMMAARFATARRDFGRASGLLQTAFDGHPGETELAIQLSLALAARGDLRAALVPLEQTVARAPEAHQAWLILSMLLDRLGDGPGALKAAHQAVTRAQRAGQWVDEATTPRDLLGPVVQAIERVRRGRRELFYGSFAQLRALHGGEALKRMDRALAGYLKEVDTTPPDPRQRPLFFHFPDLPSPPFHDPALQPWSSRLVDAFPEIRAEALAVLHEDGQTLPDFIQTRTAESRAQYLAGASARPTWQAYFFYRHGQRYGDNHARCPVTSSVLESLDLCRIADQAPEICFSVLNAQTHIKPHYGVTNTRLVMHLPLVVPDGCALHLTDAGIHEWVEGELVMFDDTFQHEAWNRSDSTRVILLMDCWNPHLSPVERQACTQLIEMISSLKSGTPQAQATEKA